MEKYSFIGIVLIIFAINILQTNVISNITSTIIDSIEHHQIGQAYTYYKYFIGISVLFLGLHVINEFIQMNVLTKLTPWMRSEFFKYLLRSNNEEMTQQNVVKFNMPIGRISYSASSILNHIISNLITNFAFIFIISVYFLYKNLPLGITFLIANVVLMVFVFYNWEYLMEYKNIHEFHMNNTEFYSLDVFTNFDKIIYRGQCEKEIGEYNKHNEDTLKSAIDFQHKSALQQLIIIVFVYSIILGAIYYLISLKASKQIDTKIFITFFTIMLLYRDKITSIVQMVPNFMEFHGRMKFAIEKLDSLKGEYSDVKLKSYKPVKFDFNEIRFENVSYRYKNNHQPILDNLNLTIRTDGGKIVGLTGPSGKGKSTIMKLLLKLHEYEHGTIYVDGVNIADVDPAYIRENITYVNQSAKLFDKPVIDNMLYGCTNDAKCQEYLDIILKYPAVKKLYAHVDLESKSAGSLGENLSGGQRQIVNILSGLVNPSKILILDEPTNALDLNLKKELLGIIDAFRKYKKCIIIITHDRDVYPLFNERIKI